MSIDTSSPALLGHIALHLTKDLGAQELPNKADIPVILKQISNLAVTCRALNRRVNKLTIFNQVFTALTDRYKIAKWHFVSHYNHKVSRRYIRFIIKEGKYHRAYRRLQEIFQIIRDTFTELKLTPEANFDKERNLVTKTSHTFWLVFRPNGTELSSPLGTFHISLGPPNTIERLALIRRLHATFSEKHLGGSCLEIQQPADGKIREPLPEEIHERTEEEVLARLGSQNLICDSNHWSCYTIPYRHSDVKLFTSQEMIQRIWYHFENKRHPQPTPVTPTPSNPAPRFASLKDVIAWLNETTESLLRAPISPPLGALEPPSKKIFLPLELSSFFCSFSNNPLNPDYFSINGISGIILVRKPKQLFTNTMNNFYTDQISNALCGWKKSTVAENPKLNNIRSEMEYQLYIKELNHSLFKSLIQFLGLEDCVTTSCNAIWIRKNKLPFICEKLGVNLK